MPGFVLIVPYNKASNALRFAVVIVDVSITICADGRRIVFAGGTHSIVHLKIVGETDELIVR